jgi:hypothetical protein
MYLDGWRLKAKKAWNRRYHRVDGTPSASPAE